MVFESFSRFAKHWMAKFNSISAHNFKLYLKRVSESRFNCRDINFYDKILDTLKNCNQSSRKNPSTIIDQARPVKIWKKY